ncbi:MAG: VPLPA-CTERM sorting domain-containing protein [Nitrospira sp.]|nr:VPLPA-CTERM sorting domain-containing protein [Nitrospira sp.]
MRQLMTMAFASAFCLSLVSAGPALANTVSIGDPTSGGVRYHLWYQFDNPGTLSARTGQALPINTNPDNQHVDAGSDGLVDTIASKSHYDQIRLGGTASSPIEPGIYGWTHTSRWALVDLNPLYANGHTVVDVSITLGRYDDGTAGREDLIPGLTVWLGKEDAGNWLHTYVNGINSANWGAWNGDPPCAPAGTCSYFPTLAQAGLAGHVWAEGDDHTNPTGTATVVIDDLVLNPGGNNYLTIVLGGRADLTSTGAAKNFIASVSVVPLPAAAWLFGAGLVGLAGMARRRMDA